MKRIHVVIPVYNGEKFLVDAVNSALGKRDVSSIILVNDGSTDNSGVICENLAEENIRVTVIHQKNGGVSRARNAGIEYILKQGITEEDYVAFLDADDLWADEVTFDVLQTVDADIYTFSTMIMDEKGTLEKYAYRQVNGVKHFPGANAGWFCPGHFGACLFSAKMMKKFNLKFLPGVKINEDVIFCNFAGFCARTIASWETPLYRYRMNPSSVVHSIKNTDDPLRVPKAWEAAKGLVKPIQHFTEEQKVKWERKCDAVIGPALLEAITHVVEDGLSYKQVEKKVFGDPLATHLSELRPENLGVAERSKLELLRKNKKLFYLKFYVKGLGKRIVRSTLRFYPVRKMREIVRFASK